jgi:flagellar motor switch protein FliN/FliY
MSSSPISSSSSDAAEATPFDAIGDLRCPVTVTLGTASITVRQCLALSRHTVLRLTQSAGEDLRVDVNGVTIARGEVSIIDTSTAIRLTELAPSGRRRSRS